MDAADVELAADALWQAGPRAVSEVALGGGRVRLIADVADPGAVPATGRSRCSSRTATPISTPGGPGRGRSGRDGTSCSSRPGWHPMTTAPTTSWCWLDPGRAFGSGSHAQHPAGAGRPRGRDLRAASRCSTSAAAAACSRSPPASSARPQPSPVDVDPGRRRGHHGQRRAPTGSAPLVHASTRRVHEVDGPFDVVVANIGVRVLLDAGRAARRAGARPAACSCSAGLLDDQVDEVVAAYRGADEVGAAQRGRLVGTGAAASLRGRAQPSGGDPATTSSPRRHGTTRTTSVELERPVHVGVRLAGTALLPAQASGRPRPGRGASSTSASDVAEVALRSCPRAGRPVEQCTKPSAVRLGGPDRSGRLGGGPLGRGGQVEDREITHRCPSPGERA